MTPAAFRKLALSSELDAMRGIGFSYGRLLRVPYVFAIGLLLVNIVIVGWVDPYARYRYEGLRYELKSGALGASISGAGPTTFALVGDLACAQAVAAAMEGAFASQGITSSVRVCEVDRIGARAETDR